MKSAFLSLIIVFSTLFGFAQGIRGLIDAMENAPSDSTKVIAFRALADHYRYSNVDSALFYARAGLAYAQKKQYVRGEALMLYTSAQALERHGLLEQAGKYYLQAQSLYKDLGDQKGRAATTNGLGVVAGRTGEYDEATRYFVEALSIYEAIEHREGIVQTLIKLGVVNDYLGNVDQALEYYLKAESLNETLPTSNATLTLLNNIGIVYGKRGELRTALMYFKKGVEQSRSRESIGVHIALLGSLGIAYEKLGLPDSARYYQQSALSLARQNQMPEEESRALVNLAGLVRGQDPDQSIEWLSEALTIAQRIHHLVLVTEIYEAMIGLYKDRHQYKLAMELAEKRQLLKDSLFSIEKSREIANLLATQDLARQENEIKALALQNERSVFQRNIMLSVAAVAVVMIFIVWHYNTRISNLNTQLIRKQEELKSSNQIKDKLFSVLGHDLRAPLSRVIGLLDVLALSREDETESGIIEKLKHQSQATLATLDNLLVWGQNQLKGIRLDQQTLQAKDRIRKSMSFADDYAAQKKVVLVDNVPPEVYVRVDPSHFDFVVRNLLWNAIKFSHPGGKVALSADWHDDQVIFSIEDSGVGIPETLQQKIFTPGNQSVNGTWNEKGTGIGLMLCREYVYENGGRLWVESKEGVGSTFFFTLSRT